MITGIAHACYIVTDLDRAIAFYRDQVGLPVAFEFRKEDGQRYGVYLKAGRRTFIELFSAAAVCQAEGVSYKHLCLEVDDMKSTVASLRAKGVEVTEPTFGIDKSWQAWLKDPEGNSFELHQYTAESWQTPFLD